MIHWMLCRLEQNPWEVFYQKELKDRFGAEFEQAKAERLIERVPLIVNGGSYSYGLNKTYSLFSDGSTIEAFDPDDPDADPIKLELGDLVQWRLDLMALAARMQRVNGWSGTPEVLGDRLVFLGEMEHERNKAVVVLGLVPDALVARPMFSTLPALFPKGVDRIAVVCPSFELPPSDSLFMESFGLSVVRMNSSNPLLLQLGHELLDARVGEAEQGFYYSDDFRSVTLNGRQFSFTPQQAQVVGILYRAYRNHTPEVPWTQIRAQLSTYPERMVDVFRKAPAWKVIVVPGTRRGCYRLAL